MTKPNVNVQPMKDLGLTEDQNEILCEALEGRLDEDGVHAVARVLATPEWNKFCKAADTYWANPIMAHEDYQKYLDAMKRWSDRLA